MRYYHMDNYRGFTDATVSINRVNFLVGENSSGKTSFLRLVKILSSPAFWYAGFEEADPHESSQFTDNVSAFSADKSYFQFGLFDNEADREQDEKAQPKVKAALFRFVDSDGLSKLSRVALLVDKTIHVLTIHENRVEHLKSAVDKRELGNPHKIFQLLKSNKQSKKTVKVEIAVRAANFPPSILISLSAFPSGSDDPEQVVVPTPTRIEDIAWFAPIRTKPQRTYDRQRIEFSPEGEHTPYLLRNLLADRSRDERFSSFLSSVGKESGLFDSICIKEWGTKVSEPFEIDVRLGDKQLGIQNVGYGISQVLPILVELFVREKSTYFAIQQPEVHLHPRAQASLGDLVYDQALNQKKGFLIETHSDFLIDRFRLRMRQSESNSKTDAQILYFERSAAGNHVSSLAIGEDGSLPLNQPEGYREFFVREELNLLGVR